MLKGELECGCMQMVHKPTFQLGLEYKYPWLIGMWRLLAQKARAWPVSKTPSLTHSLSHAGSRPRLLRQWSQWFLTPHVRLSHPPFSIPVSIPPAPSLLTLHLKEAYSWTRLDVWCPFFPLARSVHQLDLEISAAKCVNCVFSVNISNKFPVCFLTYSNFCQQLPSS